jgi:hypothetical protein
LTWRCDPACDKVKLQAAAAEAAARREEAERRVEEATRAVLVSSGLPPQEVKSTRLCNFNPRLMSEANDLWWCRYGGSNLDESFRFD